MDWENDPELKALRLEFLESLVERKKELLKAVQDLDLSQVTFIVHKLSGAAESYGFPLLSDVAGKLDDFLGSSQKAVSLGVDGKNSNFYQVLMLLVEGIDYAIQNHVDPEFMRIDSRYGLQLP